jgi:hypothetical protein
METLKRYVAVVGGAEAGGVFAPNETLARERIRQEMEKAAEGSAGDQEMLVRWQEEGERVELSW